MASDDFSITCAVNLKRFINGCKFRSLQLKHKKEQKWGEKKLLLYCKFFGT